MPSMILLRHHLVVIFLNLFSHVAQRRRNLRVLLPPLASLRSLFVYLVLYLIPLLCRWLLFFGHGSRR